MEALSFESSVNNSAFDLFFKTDDCNLWYQIDRDWHIGRSTFRVSQVSDPAHHRRGRARASFGS
jgi:hypothetical protein